MRRGTSFLMKIAQEFREFISRGNVVDLAVGVIIGAAFGKIVSSLVADIIMPPIGVLMKGVNFSDYFVSLDGRKFTTLTEAKLHSAPVITYGIFLNTVIEFLIVAFCVFLLVKAVNKIKRTEPPPPAAAVPPTKSEVLLEEIRDLLKK
jgi:large conductance mechanosensitive channel